MILVPRRCDVLVQFVHDLLLLLGLGGLLLFISVFIPRSLLCNSIRPMALFGMLGTLEIVIFDR